MTRLITALQQFKWRRLMISLDGSVACALNLPYSKLAFAALLRAAAHIRDSHSRTPGNSKSTRFLWNLSCVRAQSHATRRYFAVERPQVTRVERTGPVLFCASCDSVAANYSLQNSRPGLVTKWQTARCSPIKKMARLLDLH